MDRDVLLAIGIALLAIVALGMVAATIDSTVEQKGEGGVESGDSGETDKASEGSGDTELSGDNSASETYMMAEVPCQPWLRSPPFYLLTIVILGLLFGFTYQDTGSIFASVVLTGSFFMPISFFWYLFSTCQTAGADQDLLRLGVGNGTTGKYLPQSGGEPGRKTAAEVVSTPTVVFGLLVVVALLASVVLLFTAGRDDGGSSDATIADDDERDGVAMEALGRTAGRAADRIEEDTDVDNEVFRAWRDLTEHLDVDAPGSSTPAEFAEAAVDAGMDPEHVDALTAVFESVRYGGAEPTADRERRAVEALREIEESQSGDAE